MPFAYPIPLSLTRPQVSPAVRRHQPRIHPAVRHPIPLSSRPTVSAPRSRHAPRAVRYPIPLSNDLKCLVRRHQPKIRTPRSAPPIPASSGPNIFIPRSRHRSACRSPSHPPSAAAPQSPFPVGRHAPRAVRPPIPLSNDLKCVSSGRHQPKIHAAVRPPIPASSRPAVFIPP